MIGDYLDGRIKSLDELTLKINNAGFVISRRSVAGYLSELKNKLKPQQAEVINYNLLRCTSTKDNENLYIIGNEEQKTIGNIQSQTLNLARTMQHASHAIKSEKMI